MLRRLLLLYLVVLFWPTPSDGMISTDQTFEIDSLTHFTVLWSFKYDIGGLSLTLYTHSLACYLCIVVLSPCVSYSYVCIH